MRLEEVPKMVAVFYKRYWYSVLKCYISDFLMWSLCGPKMWSPKLLSTRFQILCTLSAEAILNKVWRKPPQVPIPFSLSSTLRDTLFFPVLNCSMHINERQIYLSASQIAFHWVSHILFCHHGRRCELNILSWLKCHSHLSLLLNSLYCRMDAQEVSKDFWKYFSTSDKLSHISQSTPPPFPLLFKQFLKAWHSGASL